MTDAAREVERIAKTFADLTPLAQSVVKKMGLEVTSYGQIKTPTLPSSAMDEQWVYLHVQVFNRICYQIGNAITDMRMGA